MRKWAYKILRIESGTTDIETVLNTHGEQGWDCYNVSELTIHGKERKHFFHLWLKRPNIDLDWR